MACVNRDAGRWVGSGVDGCAGRASQSHFWNSEVTQVHDFLKPSATLSPADLMPLPELSMGMSNDFEVAVEEGATLVRVGTTLFEGLADSRSE